MKTAKFSASGGPITAAVEIDRKRDGSYTLRLWERDANRIVPPSPWHGNFINLDDDVYPLPRPNDENHGRMLECLPSIAVPPGASPVKVSLVVGQDGNELARESRDIAPGAVGGFVSMWIALKKGA